MALKQSAAIKRATQSARNSVRDLDADAIEQLLAMYEAAADDVKAQILRAAEAGDRVPDRRLHTLLAVIDEIVDKLGLQRDELLQDGIEQAARLGVRPFTAAGVVAAGGDQAVLDSNVAVRISEAAVDFVRNFRQADGLQLSERVWRLNQGAKETLHRAIASAVIRGNSAARAASDLVLRGEPVPPDLHTASRAAQADNVAKLADLLVSKDAGEVWKAERVFRTEINRAHGEAFMAGAIKTPGFAGIRFLLSPAHPQPDICDLLAAQNIHGLGPGVYPTRELTPWPAHPNTLSFLAIVFASEISDADRAGKETELQALQRLAPEIRAGVLGQTKAQYFDRGLLTKGMIRAPLHAVERRIVRQGKLAPGEIRAAPADQVRRFVELARTGKDDRRTSLGPAGELAAAHARRALDRDIARLPRTLEAAQVRHILKEHGDAAREAARGQVAITASDLVLIQRIGLEGRRALSAETSRGSPVVEVRLAIGSFDYTLLEVVRRRDVTVGTLWKRRAKKNSTGAT